MWKGQLQWHECAVIKAALRVQSCKEARLLPEAKQNALLDNAIGFALCFHLNAQASKQHLSRSAARSASWGLPGARYCMLYAASGKP